ncbi:MAG: CHAT domain-containing protein [Cyanothece sp. SIO2G6]|nr:CHAT domain-containing protein [Cyanothece sp. SIO2G6]
MVRYYSNLAEASEDSSQIFFVMSNAFRHLGRGQTLEAIQHFQQALAIAQEQNDTLKSAHIAKQLGLVYMDSEDYSSASTHLQLALDYYQQLNNPEEVLAILEYLKNVYIEAKDVPQLLQLVSGFQDIDNPREQASTLYSIGYILEQQNQPELAILFYKQYVNISEQLRSDSQPMPTANQGICDEENPFEVYRHLADLLLRSDRVLEAQRVLDLLKVQELAEYLQDVQRNSDTQEGIANRPPEQQIQNELQALIDRTIVIQRELYNLRNLATLTSEQETRFIELTSESRQLGQAFIAFWDSQFVQGQVALLRQTTGGESLDLKNYKILQEKLAELDQNAVLLYPLVLEERLELVLVAPGAATPIRETVTVNKRDLNEAIAEYRSILQTPYRNYLPSAQYLYSLLLEPLADELDALGAETIIYAPDGQLRYIPLSALHDGEQWAVEKYRINNITAASLTNLDRLPQQEPTVFAGALTESRTVPVGDRQFVFDALPFARQEVENLATLVPDTRKLLDDEFSPDTINLMGRYSIVHLATHASFMPGDEENSFILFGDGTPISLKEVANWPLNNVDLVVLSACQTAVGDSLGDGREILGLGYRMQQAGADAAIASLWSVSDGGTQVLMDAFYAALNNGYSKAEALQRAQRALITGDETVLAGERGVTIELIDTHTGQPLHQSTNLDHPYYWAPFILIGNGL